MSQRDNRDRVQRLTLSGVLLGVMLVLGAVEHALPSFALPGVKLGLSNSVLIFAIYMLDLPTAWVLMVLKVLLAHKAQPEPMVVMVKPLKKAVVALSEQHPSSLLQCPYSVPPYSV